MGGEAAERDGENDEKKQTWIDKPEQKVRVNERVTKSKGETLRREEIDTIQKEILRGKQRKT